MISLSRAFSTERTFVMVKTDGVQRRLVGEVISRLERSGLKCVALKMLKPSRELAASNYPDNDEWFKQAGERSIKNFTASGQDVLKKFGTEDPIAIGKIIKSWIVRFMSSGKVVAMVWEGNRAADKVRGLIGETDPLSAKAGTIRGDFSIDSVINGNSSNRPLVNVVHASGNADEAKTEIAVWFKENEIFEYARDSDEVFYKVW